MNRAAGSVADATGTLFAGLFASVPALLLALTLHGPLALAMLLFLHFLRGGRCCTAAVPSAPSPQACCTSVATKTLSSGRSCHWRGGLASRRVSGSESHCHTRSRLVRWDARAFHLAAQYYRQQ